MNKKKIGIGIWGLAVIFVLVIIIPIAHAELFDVTDCASAAVTFVQDSPDLRIFSYEGRSILRSNHENKIFDNCTGHWVGIRWTMGDKHTAHGYFIYSDPDGDTFVMEGDSSKETGGIMKLLQGTGKWKGITGNGKVSSITSAKPVTQGSFQGFQNCWRYTGTFELTK